MKYFLLFITILISHLSYCQQNSNYVDSLEKIINKGMPSGGDNKTIEKQIAFIKACDAVGDYFRTHHRIKKAIYYYMLAVELDEYVLDESKKYDPMPLRNKVCLKVGDLYLNGKEIKRNLEEALFYHTRGLQWRNNPLVANHYSRLYFNSLDPFFITGDSKFTDTIKLAINILNVKNQITSLKLKNYLQQIVLKLNLDTTLHCLLTSSFGKLGLTHASQVLLGNALLNIQDYLKKKIEIPDRISSEAEISFDDCKYKSYSLPCLQIIVTKEKFN